MNLSLTIGSRTFHIGRQKSAASLAAAFARGDDLNSNNGGTLTSAFQQSTWVYACIRTVARTVAQIPLRFSREQRGGEDLIESGPVVDLFAMPHPQLNRFQFIELIVTWSMLRGEWFVLPDDLGRSVRRLTPLAPDHLREIVSGHALNGWRYTGSANTTPEPTQDFLPEELICDRDPHPFNWWRGMSPLTVASLAAQTDYSSAQFMRGLMGNNAEQGVTVQVPGQLDDAQREQALAMLRNRRRKSGSVNKDIILENDAKLIYPTLSSADLQFLENRKFNRQEICAIYGVPQEIIGFTEDANRSVSDNARLNFLENRVAPMCERIEAALQPFITRIAPGVFIYFDVDAHPLMQTARRARWDVALKQFAIGVPINVISDDLDLGLPPLAHDNKSFLPFSVQEVGEGEEGGEQTPEAGSQMPDDEDDDLPTKLAKLAKLATPDASPATTVHICAPSSPQYQRSIEFSIRLKQRKLRRLFNEQRARVLEKLSAVSGQQSASIKRGIADQIFDLFAENKVMLERMLPLIRADLQFGVAMIGNDLGLDDTFSVRPERTLVALQQRENKLRDVNLATFEQLQGSLNDGIANGETFKQLADRTRSIFNQASDSRAETIALTETNTAVNVGRFEGMKQAGVDKKSWLASNLANSRATHQQAGRDYADGIPIFEKFRVGGEMLDFPCDPNGSAENVINCKCTALPVMNEKGAARLVEVKLLSFETWAATQQNALGIILTPETPDITPSESK
jgi:HK97 family phage portal protein